MWKYHTNLEWKPGTEEAVSRCDGKPDWPVTPPPEFGGRDDRWSPEDALVAAVESCLLLSVLHFVGRLKIQMTDYRSRATGVMERTPGGLRFTDLEIAIHAEVATEEDIPKLRQAVERAESVCPVSQALNIKTRSALDIRVRSA